MNEEQRAKLQEAYVTAQADSMTYGDLYQYFWNNVYDEVDSESDEELMRHIQEWHPEILEGEEHV